MMFYVCVHFELGPCPMPFRLVNQQPLHLNLLTLVCLKTEFYFGVS
jgi:hypothetical protein